MKALYAFITALLLASCSSQPHEPVNRPGGSVSNDVSHELDNPQPRFVTDAVTIIYDDGGILMGSSAAGSHYCIDLATGTRIDFNPVAQTLYINGIKQPISEIEAHTSTDGVTRFYLIKLEGEDTFSVTYVTKF